MPVPISSGWLIRLRRIAFLELESRYSGKHFSKVSVLEYESRLLLLIAVIYRKEVRLG
jgi:hypothetical protein